VARGRYGGGPTQGGAYAAPHTLGWICAGPISVYQDAPVEVFVVVVLVGAKDGGGAARRRATKLPTPRLATVEVAEQAQDLRVRGGGTGVLGFGGLGVGSSPALLEGGLEGWWAAVDWWRGR
jgi:hypothetical protein